MKKPSSKIFGSAIAVFLMLSIVGAPKTLIGTADTPKEEAETDVAVEPGKYPTEPPDPMHLFLPKYPTSTPVPPKPTDTQIAQENTTIVTWDWTAFDEKRKERIAQLQEGINKIREAFGKAKKN